MAVFDVCFCSSPATDHHFCFPGLTFNPLLYISICQPSQLLCISSSVSVTTARLSANNSSHGSLHLSSSLMISSTTIIRNGLSPDPWCRLTLNSSVLPCMVLTTYGMLLLLASLVSLGPLSCSNTNIPDPWAPWLTRFVNLRR